MAIAMWRLEGARDTLAKTTIRSPMDGIVTARRVEEGEMAVIGVQNSPGTVLLTISDMSVVEAELEVDETSIPSVKLGQEDRWKKIMPGGQIVEECEAALHSLSQLAGADG